MATFLDDNLPHTYLAGSGSDACCCLGPIDWLRQPTGKAVVGEAHRYKYAVLVAYRAPEPSLLVSLVDPELNPSPDKIQRSPDPGAFRDGPLRLTPPLQRIPWSCASPSV